MARKLLAGRRYIPQMYMELSAGGICDLVPSKPGQHLDEVSPGIPSQQKPVPSGLLDGHIFHSWLMQSRGPGKSRFRYNARCVGQPCQRRVRHSPRNMGWQHPGLCCTHGR